MFMVFSTLTGLGEGIEEHHCPANHTHLLFMGTARVEQTRHKPDNPAPGSTFRGLLVWMIGGSAFMPSIS